MNDLGYVLQILRIGNEAVNKAQAENRRLGIPNWYSINGVIISDQELEEFKKQKAKQQSD